MPDYHETFKRGEKVRIKDTHFLREFQKTWKYHHNISDDQVRQGGKTDTVRDVAYYHGGDVLIGLENTPGEWHEQLLEEPTPREELFVPATDYYDISPAGSDSRSGIIVQGKEGEEFLLKSEWIENAERVKDVARRRTKDGFESRYDLKKAHVNGTLKNLDVTQEDEIWRKNIVYEWEQRSNFVYFIGLTTFFLILSLAGYVLTAKAEGLVLLPIGLGLGLSIYLRLLIVPISVGFSNEGLHFRYRIGEPVRTYMWTDIYEIRFENTKGDPLMPYKWKIIRIRVRRGKQSRLGVNVSNDIYEFIREASKNHSPSTTWVDTGR